MVNLTKKPANCLNVLHVFKERIDVMNLGNGVTFIKSKTIP